MKLSLFALVMPLLICGCQLPADKPASVAQEIPPLPGSGVETAVLNVLHPALNTGQGIRLDYDTKDCLTHDGIPFPLFPRVRIGPAPKGESGLHAVQKIFEGDPNVRVTEDKGLIRIVIGDVDRTILQTRIAKLQLTDQAQYNGTEVEELIEDSPEFRDAKQKWGVIERDGATTIIMGIALPSERLPHLPPLLTNITVSETLDLIAKTFGEIVMTGSCKEPRLFVLGSTSQTF